jgi:hypothetical protein
LLFVTLLAMCDRDGIVYGSKAGLTRIAMIDPDQADDAWAAIMAPDPDSSDRMRAPEHEGRRVEEVSGGFRLLNFEYYRGLRNDDERREQNRQAQAKFKAKVSQGKPKQAEASRDNPPKAHTEAETEADAETEAKEEGGRAQAPRARKGFEVPSIETVKLLMAKAGLPDTEAEKFLNHYESNGWRVGRNPMRSLPHAIGNWKSRWEEFRGNNRPPAQPSKPADYSHHTKPEDCWS